VYYANPATIPGELNQALASGFLPRRFEDPFGNAVLVDYDTYGLLVAQTTDAVGNVVAASNDYRVLAPSLVTDANGNQTAVSFDLLGMVAGTAVMGKTTENLGDSLTGLAPDLTQPQIDDFYDAADPHTLAGALLANATTRIVYDVNRFWNSKTAAPNDPTQWEPPFAATIARETHVSDLASGQSSKMQISFSHSDGFGREIQRKVQAEPDPATKSVTPRWAATGWTIFNNKGKPVRQYEPFFSQLALGQQFEFGVQIGVSPILCYDPVTRIVATLHPDQTYQKVVFDPWHQQTFDGNDNVLENDPTLDPDVGDFFQRLQNTDYTPSWYALRTDPAYAPQAALQWPDATVRAAETAAATKTEAHANTPSIAYLDSLGRPFLTVVDNAGAGKYSTRMALDIQGLQRSVTDALNREVMTYDYDVLGNRIHQSSMEVGERWTLADVAKKPIRAWDTRGHNLRTEYDPARRPIALHVQGTDANNSDSRTLAAEVLFQKTTYGEGQPNDKALNLRTRAFQTSDSAAVVTNVGHNSVTNQDEGYDFKGNLLRSTRQFVADYKPLPNWTTPPALATDLFTSSTKYDALNRPVTSIAPDGSVLTPTYNESAFLETLSVNLQGSATATPFVTNIDYDAKGRRTLIEYGNQTNTTYSYDPETFRLNRLTTARSAFPAGQQTVQDLSYVYDPVGNITHIQDDADTQNVIFFSNQRVEPSNDYTYDAIYRLIQASGREQLGLGGNGQPLAPTASSYNDVPRVLLSPSRTDGKAMGTYTETYQYDPVGNFLRLAHAGSQPQNAGWTRSYTYNQPSLLESGKVNNRLSSSAISGSQPLNEPYAYDVHGNITQMPQLQVMQWDFKDELIVTQRQSVNSSDADGVADQGERTYYVYDGGGQRARKVTESSAGIKIKERFYLGGYELYREYDSTGSVTLGRETLHVMDDKQRVALVETRTQGNDGSPAQLQRFQFSNHLGSASLELDDQAQVISYEEYCPYGNTSYQAGRSAVDVSLKRYRYTGMERDEESGLNYHGARYYATWLGRWVSPDPVGLADGPNLYWMTRNNPVKFIDTFGTDSTETTYVSPAVKGYLKQHGIKYAKEVTFELIDPVTRNVKLNIHGNPIQGRFDIVFKDPRKAAGGRLVIPELKGSDLDKFHGNQTDYIPILESNEGGMIRITSRSSFANTGLKYGQELSITGENFLRVGTPNLDDFAEALAEVAGGKKIVQTYISHEGEAHFFYSMEEYHSFLANEKGMVTHKPVSTPDPPISSTPNPGRPIGELPTARVIVNDARTGSRLLRLGESSIRGLAVLDRAFKVGYVANAAVNIAQDLARGDIDRAWAHTLYYVADFYTFGGVGYLGDEAKEAWHIYRTDPLVHEGVNRAVDHFTGMDQFNAGMNSVYQGAAQNAWKITGGHGHP